MSSHNDPVKPIAFDVIQPASDSTVGASASTKKTTAPTQRGTPVWVLPALGLLVVLAALVIFLLPAALEPKQSAPGTTSESSGAIAPAQEQAAGTAEKSPPAVDASAPWSDAQIAHQRKAAQEAAAELLELQIALQARGVEQWAAKAFAEIAALAQAGDALYKNRQFEEATAQYQQGLAALQEIQDSIPQRLVQLLEQAQAALDAGDANAALTALAAAAIIEPDNADIATLKRRAEVLPQLLPLLDEAATAEAAEDLTQAQTLLQQATKLDPLHAHAQSELQRVMAKARDRGFNQSMSAGYAALNERHFNSARQAFNAAAKLQPGSKEAASALQEVSTAETAQRLSGLDQQGRRDEQQEQWGKAVSAYEQAQKIDGSVLFASEGLQRSRMRAQLDQQLRTAIADTQRLSDAAVAGATEQLLVQAKQVTPRGSLLEQQISTLDKVLREANTTVNVTLRSDDKTEVIVYKVARLGSFAERELTLRPGSYTALGTRAGYRDVRQTFTITADAAPAPVTIICTESI
jgi:tetratricopeptide (TPR) repeat protein